MEKVYSIQSHFYVPVNRNLDAFSVNNIRHVRTSCFQSSSTGSIKTGTACRKPCSHDLVQTITIPVAEAILIFPLFQPSGKHHIFLLQPQQIACRAPCHLLDVGIGNTKGNQFPDDFTISFNRAARTCEAKVGAYSWQTTSRRSTFSS